MPHKLGQVFLKDYNAIQKLIRLSDLKPEDTVVEIGCGDGDLTQEIASRVKHVYVIEIDSTCIENTQARLKDYENVNYILSDVLKTKLNDLNLKGVKIVANVPYYISAKIVKWIIDNRFNIEMAQLMFQKEFSEKLTAKKNTKSYTSLTLYTQYFFDVSQVFIVPKTCFKPIPKVDSSVVKFFPKEGQVKIENAFFNMIRAGFHNRRKLFINSLKKNPFIKLDKSFLEIPFFADNLNCRAETMDISDFKVLYEQIKPFIIKSCE